MPYISSMELKESRGKYTENEVHILPLSHAPTPSRATPHTAPKESLSLSLPCSHPGLVLRDLEKESGSSALALAGL